MPANLYCVSSSSAHYRLGPRRGSRAPWHLGSRTDPSHAAEAAAAINGRCTSHHPSATQSACVLDRDSATLLSSTRSESDDASWTVPVSCTTRQKVVSQYATTLYLTNVLYTGLNRFWAIKASMASIATVNFRSNMSPPRHQRDMFEYAARGISVSNVHGQVAVGGVPSPLVCFRLVTGTSRRQSAAHASVPNHDASRLVCGGVRKNRKTDAVTYQALELERTRVGIARPKEYVRGVSYALLLNRYHDMAERARAAVTARVSGW